MKSQESEELSRLQAVRKVVTPSDSLRALLKSARELTDDIEHVPGSLDPLVYAAEGLRVTIYQRRLRAGKEANSLIRRVHDRMELEKIVKRTSTKTNHGKDKITKKVEINPIPIALREVEAIHKVEGAPLVVRANKIAVASLTSDYGVGAELALIIDEGSGASVLEAQRDVLLEEEKRFVAGRKLSRLAGGEIQSLEMPFMRVPVLNEHQRDELITLLSTDLPVHDIEIGPIQWKRNTVSYDES